MRKIAAIGFFVFTLAVHKIPAPPESGAGFAAWPLESKLDTALSRVEAASKAAADDRERQGYEQAIVHIRRAKDACLAFRGAEAPLYVGDTDPAACSYGLMKVMRVCAEDLLQVEAEWQRSPRPPALTSARALEITTALVSAREAFAQALRAVEGLRGWKTHKGHNGIVVSCPPEFKVLANDNFPLALHVRDANGRDKRVVLITWKYMPAKLSEWQFQERAIAAHQKNFSDFRLEESWQQWPGVPGYWFRYGYTWEGQGITSLIYQNAFGPLPWEMRYLAAMDQFDGEECEEIVRSLRRDW